MEKQQQLLDLLVSESFRYDPSCPFTLSSGKSSDIYIDAKRVLLSAKGMVLVGEIVWRKIANLGIQAIGGLTMGADPIAYATAMFANLSGKKALNVFIIRKKAKKHGMRREIEGPIAPGEKVVIVDDVVTTGGSVKKAIESALEAELKILKVVPLVDRQEGGREAVEALGLEYDPVFTKEELLRRYLGK